MKSGMLAAETICEALMSETDLKDGAKKHVIKITGGDGIVDITPNQ